ncbi:caspase-8-like isoform X3 [Grus americana]|uniref:caspase-8-like isoform X3 n=1 Tax=Grus americana TaxID=9117 RepID=UPI002407E6E7|nr:caspase-8-like isoform X3 [Grus americana]
MSTDFHKLLFDISEALVADELAALKFLSLEHIPMRKLEAIQEPKAFFEVLQEKGMIEAGNLSFLKELLYRISRIDLLEAQLGSSREEMERELQIPGRAWVSAYRQLLYGIAEDLTPEDVKSVKFLLQKRIPKNKLQDNALHCILMLVLMRFGGKRNWSLAGQSLGMGMFLLLCPEVPDTAVIEGYCMNLGYVVLFYQSMLKVLLEMERNGLIKEDDLAMLKYILNGFRADVKKKIDTYEEKKKESDSKEKLHYPMSMSVHPGAEGETPHLLVESYKMKNIPHGYCVILNNYIFKNPYEAREGTVKDKEAVERVFKWLQFETVEHMDLEAKQMYAKIKEYSKKDHSNMDCFVCFIFSHAVFHPGLPRLCRSSRCHSKRRLFWPS